MNEDDPTGIPTRAIHEAYLDMQRSLKQYRQAKDLDDKQRLNNAHGDVQESVITFYEMLRPHLRDNDTVKKYWEGRPPSYSQNGSTPDPRDGNGILHMQNRKEAFSLEGVDTDGLDTLHSWHQELDLSDDIRLTNVVGQGDTILALYQTYEMGLKRIDTWETKYQTQKSDMGGFLSGKETTNKRQVRTDVPRLRRAARELSAAAKDMGFLSNIDTPTNEDPLPI